MPIRSPNQQGALPLHLTLAMMPWLAASSALPLSKNASSGWSGSYPNPHAEKMAGAWQALLRDPKLAQSVEAEARKRAVEFLNSVHRYQCTDFARDVGEPPTVLTLGAARLLDYGAGDKNAPVIFLIPSLINRYYILDLTKKLSFAHYLRAKGVHVFIVDWGVPSEDERHFNCALYVTEVLAPMAEWIRTHTNKSILLGGYCMGGLLSLALAQIRPDLVRGLACFATPWDFSAPHFPRLAFNEEELSQWERYINSADELPAETIHTLFHSANPYAFQNKLREFSQMDPAHPAAYEFLAIQHWVNDGVPMTRRAGHDCLIDWVQYNAPARGGWRVGGQVIDPRKLRLPCFIAAPRDDKIVPSDCALPLAALIKKCTLIEPVSGHVGMIVGSRRKHALWEPFAEWVYSQFT